MLFLNEISNNVCWISVSFYFVLFGEFFLLIPSRFSIGGDILAAPGRM